MTGGGNPLLSMDDRRVSHWTRRVLRGAVNADFLFIALVTLSIAGGGTRQVAAAAAESSEEAKHNAGPAEGKRRPLQSLLQGATPEERARLTEERERARGHLSDQHEVWNRAEPLGSDLRSTLTSLRETGDDSTPMSADFFALLHPGQEI